LHCEVPRHLSQATVEHQPGIGAARAEDQDIGKRQKRFGILRRFINNIACRRQCLIVPVRIP
jgi:hypothetical protein